MSMKIPSDTIVNQTRDLLACSPVPSTPTREPINKYCHQNAELINVPVCGIYIYHSTLDFYFSIKFKLEVARGEAVG
jgi:hypothetical protein